MSIERIFYCDADGCSRHVQSTSARPPVFITVTEDAGRSLHFCSWDCVLKHAAMFPPAEVIPLAAAD